MELQAKTNRLRVETKIQEGHWRRRFLRCPVSGEALVERGELLRNVSGSYAYRTTESGIPLFAEKFLSIAGKVQQAHYEKIAQSYFKNLEYPHTQEYNKYLDSAFLSHLGNEECGDAAEICCGRGEAFALLGNRVRHGVGVDVSTSMLEAARKEQPSDRYTFVQGDATMLPLASEQFDSVFMFGGIHHVPDTDKLFSEVSRILKPGGKFYWREPVNDLFLWRWLRALIYRVSPGLDAQTEHPLRHHEINPLLTKHGLRMDAWKTYGFLGFCFFMNSDVLILNRLFRFIPGIRPITRSVVRFDQWSLSFPPLKNAGLQVIGCAVKSKFEQEHRRVFPCSAEVF